MMFNNMNKMIRCIANEGYLDITVSGIYEVYNESEKYYLITDDKYDKHLYPKSLFKELCFSCFEIAINENEILEEVAID